jgi:D-3-phosphoglycerate dehydrogenase
MNEIIITAPAHPIMEETLARYGEKVRYMPEISYDELYEIIPLCKGLIVSTRLPINASLLEKAVHLQWIGRLGSGMDIIDTAFAEKRGIKCYSSPEGNCDAVAEHALGMLLNLSKKIAHAAEEVREGKWMREENRGMEIRGKVVGIIGYGHTGSAFAKLLQGFGCRVLAHDKYKRGFQSDYVSDSPLPDLLKQSDIISMHLPLNAETRHFADSDFFSSMKAGSIFINTSRGEISDEDALIIALKSGKVRGAALDVLENEKINNLTGEQKIRFQFFNSHPNVIITPHIAGYSTESFFKMSQILLQKIGYE